MRRGWCICRADTRHFLGLVVGDVACIRERIALPYPVTIDPQRFPPPSEWRAFSARFDSLRTTGAVHP